MRITIFDTETSGLCTRTSFINEIGWANYEVDFMGWELISAKSMLIKWPIPYDYPQEVEEMTGISKRLLEKHGYPPEDAFGSMLRAMEKSDWIGGHNPLLYDVPITISNLQRIMDAPGLVMPQKVIDSMWDIEYPNPKQNRVLKYLALDHNHVMMNAHRALPDVFACAHICSSYPIDKIIETAQTPLVRMYSACDYKDDKRRELLYEQGFRWNKDLRIYEMNKRLIHLEKVEKSLGFHIEFKPI